MATLASLSALSLNLCRSESVCGGSISCTKCVKDDEFARLLNIQPKTFFSAVALDLTFDYRMFTVVLQTGHSYHRLLSE